MSSSPQETISATTSGTPLTTPKRLKALIGALWSAPHRWENRATRIGVAAVLTMSAIQTAYFFGLASPDPVEKAKAIVFSGWMDFCLFMAFIRAQRANAQEDYGKAVAWFLGCLPLAAFTFLCNFMFSSHWQPPDPLSLQRVGLSPLIALVIYACVPLVAVVYGTLFTVKEVSVEERLRRQQAKEAARWQAEITNPRERLRKMRLMRRVLAEQVGLDLDEGDEEDQACFAAYEGLLAERGISLVDRDAPIRFEALLQEMRQLGIQPRASNAVMVFRAASGMPALKSSKQSIIQTRNQIDVSQHHKYPSLVDKSTDANKRSLIAQSQQAERVTDQGTAVSSQPRTSAAEALQAMLAGDSGAWSTYLTVEEFIEETGYNAGYIRRLVRNGGIKSEEQDGVRRIPLAELARFALDRVSEELAARVLARRAAEAGEAELMVEAAPSTPSASMRAEEDDEEDD